MRIRPFAAIDLPSLVDGTIKTFRPFYEDSVRPLMGNDLFQYPHRHWEDDYRNEIPTLYAPSEGRHIAVAEIDDSIAGFVSWKVGVKAGYGQIYLLVVLEEHRRQRLGRALCEYASAEMRADTVTVVGIGTGDTRFTHRPCSLQEPRLHQDPDRRLSKDSVSRSEER
jgi:ribosomal protein S18 acetylase RimI-like enzyme